MSDCPCIRGILCERKVKHCFPSNLILEMEDTYLQIIRLSLGLYFAFPRETLQSTLAVLRGVGTLMTTLLAFSLGEKVVLTCIVYSTRVLPTSSTIGTTLNGRLTLVVERYL